MRDSALKPDRLPVVIDRQFHRRRRAHARQRFETGGLHLLHVLICLVGEELMRDSALKHVILAHDTFLHGRSEKSSCATAL